MKAAAQKVAGHIRFADLKNPAFVVIHVGDKVTYSSNHQEFQRGFAADINANACALTETTEPSECLVMSADYLADCFNGKLRWPKLAGATTKIVVIRRFGATGSPEHDKELLRKVRSQAADGVEVYQATMGGSANLYDYSALDMLDAFNAEINAEKTSERGEEWEAKPKSGSQGLSGAYLEDHFKGCVYVAGQHRVMTPKGDLMRPEVFNASFGGHVFALDADGSKTTRKAFEAFTESQCFAFPKVDALRFRPSMPKGAIFEDAGRRYVNCYVPVHGKRADGDVSLMLDHMKRLIPDDGDREILMGWIASCIQNPGKKHQWSPVLVGTEGNGKSLIGKIVRYAVGDRYTAEPRSNQLGGKFNGWIENKLFAIIEEVHMGGRREMMDYMKPLITNTVVEVEGKGRDSYDADNCCNILLCTNHKDGVIKTANDRRYAIIYTGQQSADDRLRDGMDGEYFANLWDWLENGGYAACADYFDKLKFTVDVMGSAPRTTATDDAIMQTLGGAEQCILEAVELEMFGFECGMIRSDALEAMLASKGYKMSPHRRKAALESLGYITHPVNAEGKVKISGKPCRVYVKIGHISSQLDGAGISKRLGSVAENESGYQCGAF